MKRWLHIPHVAAVVAILTACGGGGSGTTYVPPVTPPPPPVVVTDWAGFQGDAGHTGHVDESYVPASFSQAWVWTMPAGTRNWMNLVATGDGKIFVTEDAQQSHLYALDEATGSVLWTQILDSIETGGPAYANGHVYVTSQTSDQSTGNWPAQIHVIDSKAGVEQTTADVHTQMGRFFPVTPYGGAIYSANDDFFNGTGGLVYGTELTSFSGDGTTRNWIAYDEKSQSYTSQSVAVDSQYVYFYRSYSQGGLDNALIVLDRDTGSVAKEIPDTRNVYSGYDYYGAPIVSSPGHVLAYSGPQFVTSVSLEENFSPRQLVHYDIAAGDIDWATADLYSTAPAVRDGTIFAASNTTHRLDAIDEGTGHVLWSWPTSSGESFIRNIVASNNLVFVSTDAAVYAIDQQTHQPVWSVPTPGGLSIAAHKYLLIASPARRDNAAATLTAIKLK